FGSADAGSRPPPNGVSVTGISPCIARTSYPISNNRLHDQSVGRIGQPESDAGVELPSGTEIHIDRREQLLLGARNGVEPGQGTVGAVVFQRAGDRAAEVERDLRIGREFESARRI